jgi:hypothetical protein
MASRGAVTALLVAFGTSACALACGNVLGYDAIQFTGGSEEGLGGSGAEGVGGEGAEGGAAGQGAEGGEAGGGAEAGTGPGGGAGEAGSGGTGGDAGSAGSAGAPPDPPLVTGLDVTGVTVYQGVAIPIMKGGQAVTSRNGPVVRLRQAMVRVYVTPTADWQPRAVLARLQLEAGGQTIAPLELTLNVSGASNDQSLGSTFNFDVPGAQMTSDLNWSVTLFESGGSGPGSSGGARWPAQGTSPMGALDSRGNVKITIVPFQYNGDGSGRLPDTSQGQMDLVHRHFFVQYPAPDTEITVHGPVPFNSQFSPWGQGWDTLLNATCSLRQKEHPARNVYYYGMLAPASSFAKFCSGGCIAGLSNLAQSPNDDYTRCSIGLGFSGSESAVTATHEVGHAFGRSHAPCGGPDGVDPKYPYSGAKIGVWGYDLVGKSLKAPTSYVDFMAYCSPTWISDYTYRNIFNWLVAVNGLVKIVLPPGFPARWRSVLVRTGGSLAWGETTPLHTPPAGEPQEVTLLGAAGKVVGTSTGYLYPYEGMPGGTLLMPEPTDPSVKAIRIGSSAPLPL